MLKLQKQLHVKIVTSFLGMKNLRHGRLSCYDYRKYKKVIATKNQKNCHQEKLDFISINQFFKEFARKTKNNYRLTNYNKTEFALSKIMCWGGHNMGRLPPVT